MKTHLIRILSLLLIALLLCGCQKEEPLETSETLETTAQEVEETVFPEGQRLRLKVTPGNNGGAYDIVCEHKGSNPHVYGVSSVTVFLDGEEMDLGDAVEAKRITVEELEAYARIDAKEGFCQMEYATRNGFTLYVYHYDDFDIATYYDVYTDPDGRETHFQKFAVASAAGPDGADIGNFRNIGKYSVHFPYDAQEDWGLTIDVTESTADHLTLQITQSGVGQHFGQLSVSEVMHLYKINEDQSMVGYSYPSVLPAEETYLCDIPNNGSTELVISWTDTFGQLESGNYRVQIDIQDIFDPEQLHPLMQDFTERQGYQIEFTVP